MHSAGSVAPPVVAKKPLHLVSYHAVTRYVQRILGVVIRPDADGWTSVQEAEEHCAAVGLIVKEVQATILTPEVLVASAARLSWVRTPHFRAHMARPTGVITTIKPVRPDGPTKRLRVITRREGRRLQATHNRTGRNR